MIRNQQKKIVLAPMAGITDLPFRLICKELGAETVYSEMLSVAGLTYNKTKNLSLVNSCQQDQPLIIQLFGSKPEQFKKATTIINSLPKREDLGKSIAPRKPEGVDINFGCPVKKIIKQNSGCALMKNTKLSYEIIKAVTENTSLPVSIKIRAGIEDVDALKFLEKVSALSWETVIVHGRTYKEGFSGPINFVLIKKIKELYPQKIVIANGGINTPADAKEIFEKTNADGVAIARGCLGNPWLFSNIKTYLKNGTYEKPTPEEVRVVALRHIDYFLKYKGAEFFLEMRKHLGWYFKGSAGAKDLRKKLYSIETPQEAKDLLNKL